MRLWIMMQELKVSRYSNLKKDIYVVVLKHCTLSVRHDAVFY